jgi:hypothetical protein
MRKVHYRRIFFSDHSVFERREVLEIVMTSLRMNASISRAALAAFAILACRLSTGAALASQGPGGGVGTASHFTQVAMTILVYGVSAIVVAAGLIGAARGR